MGRKATAMAFSSKVHQGFQSDDTEIDAGTLAESRSIALKIVLLADGIGFWAAFYQANCSTIIMLSIFREHILIVTRQV